MHEPIPKNVRLSDLFLDPNNYRFIDNINYASVPIEKELDNDVQKRTRGFVSGRNNNDIQDLLSSFAANGFVPVDQIQVREIINRPNQYIVVEGNRRITALKTMAERHESGFDIGKLDPLYFTDEKIPVVVYRADDEITHLVMAGLKHITGNVKWPTVNQARLLADLEEKGMSESKIKDMLGMSTVTLRRQLRTLALVKAYQKSDFGDKFKADMFNIFAEAIRKPDIMNWLEWEDNTRSCANKINMNRFFSWVSPDEENNEDSEEEQSKKFDPIITRGSDVREIATFIYDETALKKVEQTRNIQQGYLTSSAISKDKFRNIMDTIDDQTNQAFNFINAATPEDLNKLLEIQNKLARLSLPQAHLTASTGNGLREHTILAGIAKEHFTSLYIKEFKFFKNVTIDNINKINIFAGDNNSGKSTILEAIYYLVRQNDADAFFDLQRRRGKFAGTLPLAWLQQEWRSDLDIEAKFDNQRVSINITKEQEQDETINKTKYLDTFTLISQYANENAETRSRIFRDNTRQDYYKKTQQLCRLGYSSPFSIANEKDLEQLYAKNVEEKNKKQVVQILKNAIDEYIEDFDMVTDNDIIRFKFQHQNFNTLDLTQFGDGFQRVFNILMQFAYAKNGVVLIDEVENGVHFELLEILVKAIKTLSEQFNVQVFLTSHSKECIDAFFTDRNDNKKIAAYRMERENDLVKCRYDDGYRFGILIDNFGADLRGGRGV
ncbi:MAG: hypothetical protein RI894_1287 [Bacteroidota bacterium]